jgi:hypothetical protein
MIYFLYKVLTISFYFIYINQVKGDRRESDDWGNWGGVFWPPPSSLKKNQHLIFIFYFIDFLKNVHHFHHNQHFNNLIQFINYIKIKN